MPIARLAGCLDEAKEDIEEMRLVTPIVGHVGDGNFHVSVMAKPDDKEEGGRIAGFLSRLNRQAIAMNGTCTGKHGVGQGGRECLVTEFNASVETMPAIERLLDPDNTMNPGKFFPTARVVGDR